MTTTNLWAVHVEGPDDILAMPSKADAEKYANHLNAAYEQFTRRPDHDSELDPRWHGVVIPWDGTTAEHDAYLAELREDDEVMQAAAFLGIDMTAATS